MKKKQILIIAPSINVKGGISTVVKGHLGSELSNKYQIFRVSSHKDGNKLIKLLTAVKGAVRIIFYLLSKHIDIVHIHGSDPLSSLRKYFLFRIVEQFNCKTIYHFHGASFLESYVSKSPFFQHKINYLFRNVDRVICLSNTWEKQIAELIPGTARTVVIQNTVSLPERRTEKDHQEKKEVYILFLGLIGDRKGIFDLLKVMVKLKKAGHRLKLYVGGNGDVNKLEQTIDSLNIRDMVAYKGWVTGKDKETLYLNSDLYVLPSYGEGMPMSILEAMSYGLPVISTDVGGIPDLIEDDKTGFLIEPGDLHGMFNKIEILIKDRKLRSRMGMNARKKIEKEYNFDANISKLDALYQTLIAD
ncbi:glycosyltransferase family 4 protein [uncultured Desulfobacter sp.]|uniref:glycosyltransferase family 4 protein n=1 Tax=uncultured Desulfobacter sp. TaxID=240139 RepID=UPI002AA74DF6|nr:glycosyltransferase family 4 protein [uncultured Desulfobacter sp.]